MRLHRFFSHEKILQKKASGNQDDTSDLITPKIATDQWRRVFRFGPGDRVILFDGSGKDFVCEIREYKEKTADGEGGATLKIIEIRENKVKPVRNVSLYAAIVKKDTFEWIAEKAAELGVSDIIPVIAERSEKKNLNPDRLEKIIMEASEQSGRGTIPKIHQVVGLAEAIAKIRDEKRQAIAFDPGAEKFSGKDFSGLGDIAVFVGPEGGWSPDEIGLFKHSGIPVVSLGPQILRAETAAVAALSRLIF